MRGKKIDSQFISQFIEQSISEGLNTPEQFVKKAKNLINEIDKQIKEIEQKKIIRSKLLDVISSFPIKEENINNFDVLPLFKLEYPKECKIICDYIKDKPIYINDIKAIFNTTSFNFSIKQLLQLNILQRNNDLLDKGEMFFNYIRYVLRENERD